MADLHKLTLFVGDLQPGDIIVAVQHGTPMTASVRRRMPIELPTEPYTSIHSVWDGSANVAEFDAMLLPPRFNLFGEKGQRAQWLLDTGEKMTADELAMKISYYDVKGIPVTDD